MTSCLSFLYTGYLLKGVYSKRKEFALNGNQFFAFRVDPSSEGRQNLEQVILITYICVNKLLDAWQTEKNPI